MEMHVSFLTTRHYDVADWSQMKWWVWYFKKFRYIRGFNLRILGVCIQIKENNATEKLIAIAHKQNEERMKKPFDTS